MYDNFLITSERERERDLSKHEERGRETFVPVRRHAFGEFGTSARVKRALIRAIIAVVTNQLHLGSIPQKPTMNETTEQRKQSLVVIFIFTERNGRKLSLKNIFEHAITVIHTHIDAYETRTTHT